jgi:hypothetical protein
MGRPFNNFRAFFLLDSNSFQPAQGWQTKVLSHIFFVTFDTRGFKQINCSLIFFCIKIHNL